MNSTKFFRLDYAQVGTTSRGCLRVIHQNDVNEKDSKKSKKKAEGDKVTCFLFNTHLHSLYILFQIVVGGHNGILLCIERKNGDTNVKVYLFVYYINHISDSLQNSSRASDYSSLSWWSSEYCIR